MAFKQKPKWTKSIIHANICWQSIPGKWNSMCKGLKAKQFDIAEKPTCGWCGWCGGCGRGWKQRWAKARSQEEFRFYNGSLYGFNEGFHQKDLIPGSALSGNLLKCWFLSPTWTYLIRDSGGGTQELCFNKVCWVSLTHITIWGPLV